MTKTYKHLFFDLDRTLWDYDQNVKEAFRVILDKYKVLACVDNLGYFVTRFHRINETLWADYRKGTINKLSLRNKRFELLLSEYALTDSRLIEQISDDYIEIAPAQTRIFPHTTEVLNYLAAKYRLHIITNGFKEVQHRKLANCGLAGYFETVVTSDSIGIQKPHSGIFAYALNSVNARKAESLMTGDDLDIDIAGAKKYGIDQVYFNPHQHPHNYQPTYEIFSLLELKALL